MKITVDLDKLKQLTAEGENILVKPEAENALVQLLDLQQKIEEAIETAKLNIEKKALELNPNFQSVQSDRIKVYYRAYGAKYYIDESQMHLAPRELYEVEEKVAYKIDANKVEKWIKEHDAMPAGINEVERKKSISISLK